MSENQHSENEELNIEGCSREGLKRNSFQTPDGYFENLTPRMMDVVRASGETVAKPSFNWQRILFPTIGVATAVLITLFIFNPNETDNLEFDKVVSSLTLEELDDFADFETEELLAYGLVTTEDVEFESDFTEDELIDYLLEEEELELNSIYEEIDI